VTTAVELDVFAGRPNPHWVLSPEAESELRQMIDRLQEPAEPVPPRLGYRGFVVLTRTDAWSRSARVLDGTVSVEAGSFRDTEGIESWLERQAEHAGLGEVLDAALAHRRAP